MPKYETTDKTSVRVVKELLRSARKEKRIYVIANLVGILRFRHKRRVNLSSSEKSQLLRALRSIRSGKKVLAHWLPIGYQTARFISLARALSGHKVIVTRRDLERMKRAARFYRNNDDFHNRRQLRSLIQTAKSIGVKI